MACIIEISLYMNIWSIWPQMVVEHHRRSTCTRPLRELGYAPHGDHCQETMELEGREPTINTPPHHSRHPNKIHETGRFWFEECRNLVSRYGTCQLWWSTRLRGAMKSRTERVSGVSNGSNPLVQFGVRVGTETEPWQWVLPHKNPECCNWAGFTTTNPAFQPHNCRSN